QKRRVTTGEKDSPGPIEPLPVQHPPQNRTAQPVDAHQLQARIKSRSPRRQRLELRPVKSDNTLTLTISQPIRHQRRDPGDRRQATRRPRTAQNRHSHTNPRPADDARHDLAQPLTLSATPTRHLRAHTPPPSHKHPNRDQLRQHQQNHKAPPRTHKKSRTRRHIHKRKHHTRTKNTSNHRATTSHLSQPIGSQTRKVKPTHLTPPQPHATAPQPHRKIRPQARVPLRFILIRPPRECPFRAITWADTR